MQMLKYFLPALVLLVLAQALPSRAQHAPYVPIASGIVGTITASESGEPLIGATITVAKGKKRDSNGTVTDFDGSYALALLPGEHELIFSYFGYTAFAKTVTIDSGEVETVDIALEAGVELEEVLVIGYGTVTRNEVTGSVTTVSDQNLRSYKAGARKAKRRQARGRKSKGREARSPAPAPVLAYRESTSSHTGESYAHYTENAFLRPTDAPLSTFGADVDVAAYANVRRFLNLGELPPADAVRTEELVNYFRYDYPQPRGKDPVAFSNELGACPWNPAHQLLRVGVQARALDVDELPPSNLVFLLDVSGSMNQPEKLPLLKQSFRLLVDQLRAEDRVSIVVYAGAAGTVLEPTSGAERDSILSALERLRAGGSTAGGAGIHLAYRLAARHFVPGGNNRVILATDGDFNVGTTGEDALEKLIADKRRTGVFLSVLGFGGGNYQDTRMQSLAETGNGNAAYIDNLLEAQKVLVEEFGGTLHTVAKDVKLQVEFNPAAVAAYRLIGYESRLLDAEDFNDDRKDAGDMGAGHDVTALYEIIPAGTESSFLPSVEPLKYQREVNAPAFGIPATAIDLATVRMKYKRPDARESADKIEVTVSSTPATATSNDFRWAAAVAGWSLLLKDSELLNRNFSYVQLLPLAEAARGADEKGYRAEALRLMGVSASLKTPELAETR